MVAFLRADSGSSLFQHRAGAAQIRFRRTLARFRGGLPLNLFRLGLDALPRSGRDCWTREARRSVGRRDPRATTTSLPEVLTRPMATGGELRSRCSATAPVTTSWPSRSMLEALRQNEGQLIRCRGAGFERTHDVLFLVSLRLTAVGGSAAAVGTFGSAARAAELARTALARRVFVTAHAVTRIREGACTATARSPAAGGSAPARHRGSLASIRTDLLQSSRAGTKKSFGYDPAATDLAETRVALDAGCTACLLKVGCGKPGQAVGCLVART